MLKIVAMTDADLAEVVAIEKLSFLVPKDESVFQADENKYLVARQEDKIVGYIGVEEIAGEKHIINMAVRPANRREGIGKKLLESVLDDKHVFFLEVRASNLAAQKLYEGYGFRKAGKRKHYYSDNGEDALIMRRETR